MDSEELLPLELFPMRNCSFDPMDDVNAFRTLSEDLMRMSSIWLVFVRNQVTVEYRKMVLLQLLKKIKSVVLIEFVLAFLLPHKSQVRRWNKKIKLRYYEALTKMQ